MFESTRRRALQALGIGGTAAVAGCSASAPSETDTENPTDTDAGTSAAQGAAAKTPDVDQIARDPADMPGPIDRDEPKHHDITLEAEEVTAEIEPGVTFDYMTFGGTVPGPMIRVRQGDTVSFTLKNLPDNNMPHNVDMHAIYGTGGGSVATTAAPGESNSESFKAMYPGAYIYHCAVPNLDYHISSGMFGMIVVEPKEGLPEVDKEFYVGQHEIYTDRPAGQKGHHAFDMNAMADENPTYVVLNGEKYAYAAARHGPLEVDRGDSVRVFLVDGGPNVSSNFHPIGNVWAKAYRDGAFEGPTEKNVQTMKVPPGSCMVGTMETPVPERIKLVDHALSRVVRKGHLAEIDVLGDKQNDIFDPEPNGTDEGPIYGGGSGE